MVPFPRSLTHTGHTLTSSPSLTSIPAPRSREGDREADFAGNWQNSQSLPAHISSSRPCPRPPLFLCGLVPTSVSSLITAHRLSCTLRSSHCHIFSTTLNVPHSFLPQDLCTRCLLCLQGPFSILPLKNSHSGLSTNVTYSVKDSMTFPS